MFIAKVNIKSFLKQCRIAIQLKTYYLFDSNQLQLITCDELLLTTAVLK